MTLDEVMGQPQREVMSVVTRHAHRLSPSGAREVVEFIRDELATCLEGLGDGPRTCDVSACPHWRTGNECYFSEPYEEADRP